MKLAVSDAIPSTRFLVRAFQQILSSQITLVRTCDQVCIIMRRNSRGMEGWEGFGMEENGGNTVLGMTLGTLGRGFGPLDTPAGTSETPKEHMDLVHLF